MKLRYIGAVGILLLLFACKEVKNAEVAPPQEVPVALEPQAPKPLYENMDGKPIALSDYHDKKVILNYWATWCRPCIAEMPSLERLQSILPAKEYVLLLASDQSMKEIKKFKKTKGYNLEFIKYNGTWADENITALPTTFIINALGEKVERIVGETAWDTPEMIQKLKDLR